jgi:hypothetical protein
MTDDSISINRKAEFAISLPSRRGLTFEVNGNSSACDDRLATRLNTGERNWI